MKQPLTIYLTMGLLTLYGVYSLFEGYMSGYWPYGLVGTIALLGSAGLYLSKPWSRFVIYLVAGGVAAAWLYETWIWAPQGNFLQRPVIETLLSFLPGIIILFLCGYCSHVVCSHFKKCNS
jgi:hypothetical protein